MRISQLEGRRVALWGWGREGRAAHALLRSRLPSLPLTLFCSEAEAGQAAALGDPLLHTDTQITGAGLGSFDVIIKSPGISPYSPEALEAQAAGARLLGGTALWFGEHPDARTVCVTGTKGKSTTTALLAHLLRAGGHRTALAGNIGLPLLEVMDPQPSPELWAIELSSYQTRAVADGGVPPEVAVVLNIFPEHLDWHGSQQRYIEDKLALVTEAHPRIAVLNAADPVLSKLQLPHSRIVWFNHADGWHLRGDVLFRGDTEVFDTRTVPLPGRHNRGNLCAVLAAIEALGYDAAALAPAAVSFQPLPNRLQTIGMRDGLTYVNDSISTTPHATLAALECFAGQRIALLVGGHDRGLDWHDFADAMGEHAPLGIVTMGGNGPRIHALLEGVMGAGQFQLAAAPDLAGAMHIAQQMLGGQGVVLMSPGAPSFGMYRDYVERGKDFARIAGFDPEAIVAIPGLGVG
ncbi:UDP-N-acetylmuramoyl-L-alanine--D-glutamate ligase [Pseudoxanthomonas sp.]|uniref:UDP-N-acetylmuramoyl-L-alanine--D-glutamate ligase n=1 Tax=Pseudoxanthomonas sp. TaxID=1871049 RepID=UPI00262205C0|nr:UDP-N-acetylmuramoyl-L-alanine--D-glutamate ligase [Pseudoxanthomonas sp.]WDS37381.1 MAG: UDP-N-acetylmuramoyl-L-alanine--D-glutamate ligase [Pseudoxanthomonas sp.]